MAKRKAKARVRCGLAAYWGGVYRRAGGGPAETGVQAPAQGVGEKFFTLFSGWRVVSLVLAGG